MNKDTIVASAIGFSLGLVAAIALWVVPRILPKQSPSASPETVVEESAPLPDATPVSGGFTVTSPSDGEVVTQDSVKITGSAKGSSLITVSTPDQSLAVPPAAGGEFSVAVDLSEGANQVVVGSFAPQKQETKTVTVYYYADGI